MQSQGRTATAGVSATAEDARIENEPLEFARTENAPFDLAEMLHGECRAPKELSTRSPSNCWKLHLDWRPSRIIRKVPELVRALEEVLPPFCLSVRREKYPTKQRVPCLLCWDKYSICDKA